ncbi:MAG: YncE family protein [Bacteroidota bacterium]
MSCKKDSRIFEQGDYPPEIANILVNKCATSGCHNDASYQGAANFNITTYTSLFKGSNNGSPIIPFRSDFSLLCNFINTYPELGLINLPTMPLNETALSKTEVKTIKDWIDKGAPDKNGKIMWSDNLLRKKYYVLNQGCDVVTVFDTETQLPIRCITVGNKPNIAESPHRIIVSPDGNYWYVVFVGNNILQKYRSSDDSFVKEVNMGTEQNWNTITISNDGKKAYCVAWPNGNIAIVNLEKMQLIHYYKNVFLNGHGNTLNQTNDTLYVTSQTGNFIYKIDTGFTTLPIQISLDPSQLPSSTSSLDPHEITFSFDGTKYFVTCQKSNEVRVFRTVGDSLLKIIPTGQFPQEIIKSALTNKLYVTCQEDQNANSKIKGSVTTINMSTYASENYKVGYEPHGIAIDELGGFLMVASRNLNTLGPTPHHSGVCGRNGFINYFNLSSMELLNKKTEVAADPYSISVRK